MIYLDHNAATPVDPRVLEAMLPWLRDKWGNASSRDHAYGWDAQEAVDEARFQVAGLLGAGQHEIIFTSGATESVIIALHGLFTTHAAGSKGLIASAVEHEAVLGTCRTLAKRGFPVRLAGVDAKGRLDLPALESMLAHGGADLVCAMAANNETGTVFPLRACADLAHAHGALLFTDAAQALGRLPLDSAADGFDLAAFSAHKLGGPKGAGALYVRGGSEALALEPLAGGGREGGIRAGTLDVPAIVGFGEACRLAAAESAGEMARLRVLRDRLESGLMARFPGIRVNGDGQARLANTANLVFPGADARAFIRAMNDIAVSTRSACSSGSPDASHVLTAMGLDDRDAFASVRFSLGRITTEADIEAALRLAGDTYAFLIESRR